MYSLQENDCVIGSIRNAILAVGNYRKLISDDHVRSNHSQLYS